MSDRMLTSGAMRIRSGAVPRPWLRERIVEAYGSMRTAWRRYRSRQRISELDARTLKDIGVTFAEAEAEANKPFWRG